MDIKNILIYGGIVLLILIIIRKVFAGKKDTFQSDEPTLDLSKRMEMTQAQVHKVLESAQEAGWLIGEGFEVTEQTPYKITATLKKDNYFCEFKNYYELEGKKVKKVVMELNGHWAVGNKTKKIKGRTTQPFSKWNDWDEAYEQEIENLPYRYE